MISVIVPVMNERDNIESLVSEIYKVSQAVPITEIVYVDDGSTDDTFDLLKKLKATYPILRVLQHKVRSGQSSALWTGISAAKNEIVVTLDGDGQNDPADIALLYEAYRKLDKDHAKTMVLGERKKRNDNWIRRISSRLANGIRAKLLKDNTRDTGCSLKLFRRKDYLILPYFDHMHRFLPALMMREKVGLIHIPVSHRHRVHGQSKYGTLDRLLVGISDIRGVLWLQSRSRRVDSDDVYEELG